MNESTAPTENTGDEGLREKIAEIIYGVGDVPQNAFLADVEAIMALIRQDRRELLTRLRKKLDIGILNAVDHATAIYAIDRELQHGAESAAIDYGGGNRG